ncbi:hypothetical protein [Aquimarina megaterium]|uniref:hypothetical protein n=1 Tax=Aquimarina megaterium TaxID=1443666 RepID=UPI000945AF38|nr:hypothetical protein [Aquimarina megaterium]
MKNNILFSLFTIGFIFLSQAQQFGNTFHGSNGAGGLSGYGIYTSANTGQATLGAEGIGDRYANLNLGSNISGVRRFWHISKRTSASNHSLQFFHFDGNSFNSPLFTFSTSGRLGIGINNPISKLHVVHNGSNGAGGLSSYGVLAQANTGQATLGAEVTGDRYANLNLGSNISGVRRFWHISKRTSTSNHSLQFFHFDGNSFNSPLFTFSTSGNLGIGVDNPDSKLVVDGKIRSEEIIVEIIAGADFVFANDYQLLPLKEVENFVKKNKHLPEIASAKEMKKDGVHLAEMNIKLLQKIEELTLYTIQQEKEIKELKSLNTKLQKLHLRLEKLESKK